MALDVDEALAFGLGHREERVHHDSRGHHGVAEEGAVESAALGNMAQYVTVSVCSNEVRGPAGGPFGWVDISHWPDLCFLSCRARDFAMQ